MNKQLLWCFILVITGTLALAALPSFDVTVTDSGGKIAFRGHTNSAGAFATGKLPPGDYVVQFRSSVQGTYGLAVSGGGKTSVVSESVEGEKFAKGGIAMRVKLEGANISGRVSNNSAGALSASRSNGAKMKIVNGRRWYWVTSSTGSNIGGHWVEEGTPEARNLANYNRDAIYNLQEKARGTGNEGGGVPVGKAPGN